MLTLIYIEALLVDEELADQVWEAWESNLIDSSYPFLGTNFYDQSIALVPK